MVLSLAALMFACKRDDRTSGGGGNHLLRRLGGKSLGNTGG
jgi:hypothetical protein